MRTLLLTFANANEVLQMHFAILREQKTDKGKEMSRKARALGTLAYCTVGSLRWHQIFPPAASTELRREEGSSGSLVALVHEWRKECGVCERHLQSSQCRSQGQDDSSSLPRHGSTSNMLHMLTTSRHYGRCGVDEPETGEIGLNAAQKKDQSIRRG